MNEYLLQQEAELEQENISLERRLNYAREYNLPKPLISNLEYKLELNRAKTINFYNNLEEYYG